MASTSSPTQQLPNGQVRPMLKKRHTTTRLPKTTLPQNKSSTKLHRSKQSRDVSRRTSAGKQRSDEETEEVTEEEPDEEDDEMSSFLQYCATCEKQLPGSSVLYCSEICRRKDIHSISTYQSSSPTSRASRARREIHKDIVPQMSPTEPTKPMHYFNRESSGTERAEARGRSKRDRPSHDRSDSEAARYLAQFHSDSRPSSKQRDSRPSTAGEDTLPGLSFTPTSPAFASTPYTPSTTASYRPARKNRYSSSFASHTEELVTPIVQDPEISSLSTITETSAKGNSMPTLSITSTQSTGALGTGTLSYEKRRTIPDASPRLSNLKQRLLHFDEVKAGVTRG